MMWIPVKMGEFGRKRKKQSSEKFVLGLSVDAREKVEKLPRSLIRGY